MLYSSSGYDDSQRFSASDNDVLQLGSSTTTALRFSSHFYHHALFSSASYNTFFYTTPLASDIDLDIPAIRMGNLHDSYDCFASICSIFSGASKQITSAWKCYENVDFTTKIPTAVIFLLV